jgi:hypothetical protein
MRKSGAHQGTVVVPPLPASDPVIGDIIAAYNAPSPLSSTVSLLRASRFNIAPGQSTVNPGTPYAQPCAANPWSVELTFNCQANFGSWDNARYFFNSGGSLSFSGATSVVDQWSVVFGEISPTLFKATTTEPQSGIPSGIGFYDLTTTLQAVYIKTLGVGYYVGSTFAIYAKLNAAAGTNGIVDFAVVLYDADGTPDPKTSTTTYTLGDITATGSNIAYPGSLTFLPNGPNNGFVAG